MTRNRKAKAEAREWAVRNGRSYSAARRHLAPLDSPGAESPSDAELAEMYELPDVRKSAEELIARAAQHVCDDLIEQPVSSLGEIELPDELDLREPAVHDLQIAPETLVVYTDELISDDTAVGNASADASLTVQGLLPKAKAVAAARDGLVRIIDHNYSHRRSLVAFTTKQQLEVEFEVIFVLDSESVNSVVFSGATQLIPHSAEHGFRCG